MRFLLLAILACGTPGAYPPVAPRYTHASQLLEDFGAPCARSGAPPGLEVWRYCAGECQLGQEVEVCVVACSPGCPSWGFHVVGGAIVYTEGP